MTALMYTAPMMAMPKMDIATKVACRCWVPHASVLRVGPLVLSP
jgi:hypothetical protein